MPLQTVLLFLHIVGVLIWVGGMFFAYVCLRPTAATVLEPPLRLRLWQGVLGRFFNWVWLAVALILVSGLAMFGMGLRSPGVHLMLASGVLMVAIFAYVALVPYRNLVRAVAAGDWPAGALALGHIRQLVATNLALGGLTIAFATLAS